MKSASWAGAIVLLFALAAVYLFERLGGVELPALPGEVPSPGEIVVEAVAIGGEWEVMGTFTEEVNGILQREVAVDPGQVKRHANRFAGGPAGSSYVAGLSWPASAAALERLQPALLGAAVETLGGPDGERELCVRVAHASLAGERVERYLVRVDGRLRWSEQPPAR